MNSLTRRLAVFGSCCATLGLVQAAGAVGISPGNIVVVRVGTGSAALAATGTATFLEVYQPDGTLVAAQGITLPTAVVGSQRRLVLSGSATSEGFLTLSGDGQYLFLMGYDANTAATVTSVNATTINRVVARVKLSDGTLDTSTALTDFPATGSSGLNPRSAASTNGTNIWVAGATAGPHYTTFGTAGTSTQVSTTLTNLRVLNIANSGQLYTSASSGAFLGVNTIGSGAPTGTGNTIAVLPGMPPSGTTHSAYDYFFSDANTLYIADDGSAGNGGGVQKWTLAGGTWSLQYTFNSLSSPSMRGVSGTINADGKVVLYATSTETSNFVRTVTDLGSGSPFFDLPTQVAAGTNKAFRGIRVIPGGTACGAPTITGQPAASVTATTCTGTTTIGPVTASGTPKFQWQVSTDGGVTWTNAAGASATTATLTTAAGAFSGTQYRCIVANACGAAASTVSTLTSDVPATPTGTAVYAVFAGTQVNMSVTVPSGVTADWYSTSCSGTIVTGGTGTTTLSYTPSTNGTTTQFFVKARNSTSGCTSATCLTVSVNAGYCTAGSGDCVVSNNDERIAHVVVNPLPAGAAVLDYAYGNGDGPSGCYLDTTTLPSPVPATTFFRGQQYTITVTNGATSYYTSDNSGVWCDWNQDLSFATTSPEQFLLANTNITTPTATFTGTITVPATATLGNTRMRVRIGYSTAPSPCGIPSSNYGDVQDFAVIVADPPIGACCNGTTCIPAISAYNCAIGGGGYQGDGQACNASLCVIGACCTSTGSCSQVVQTACTGTNAYLGDNSTCGSGNANCPAYGRCCSPTGGCSFIASTACAASGATFITATACAAAPCVVGACCTGTACIPKTTAGCTAGGGAYGGDGSNCFYRPPTTPGTVGVDFLDTSTGATQLTTPDNGNSFDDGYFNNIPIPFTFRYFGVTVPTVAIDANGFVMLPGPTATGALYGATLPSGAYNSIIEVFTKDLDLRTGGTPNGKLLYQTKGASPNRRFIIEWFQAEDYHSNTTGGQLSTFEIIFYEGSDLIEFRYDSLSSTLGNAGMQNADGSLGFNYTPAQGTNFFVPPVTGPCAAASYALGGCCDSNFVCTPQTKADCTIAAGIFQGTGVGCNPNPCAVGACCAPDGSCTGPVLAGGCTGGGGFYQGNETSCGTNTCPTQGCCNPNGTCAERVVQACTGGQVALGVGSTCGSACPAFGRCCVGNACSSSFQNNCANPGTNWLAGQTCQTNACAYCNGVAPVVGLPCGSAEEWISNTKFSTINNSSACLLGYEDFTTSVSAANLNRGDAVVFTVTDSNWYSSDSVVVYIDWNRNNILDDTGEVVRLTDPGTGNPRLFTATINVPLNAVLGASRVRVRLNYSDGGLSAGPCDNTSYGNVEDYAINILPEPNGACCLPDLSCQSAPASACTSTYGGTPQGVGSACTTGLCNTRACCVTDGSVCSLMTQPNCLSAGGLFNAGSATCAGVSCPAVGRCCSGASTCSIVLGDEAHCTNLATNFIAGATCATNPCAYCGGVNPTITYPCDDGFDSTEFISRVTFASINKTSTCGLGYEDYTALTGGTIHLNDAVAISVRVTNYFDSTDTVTVFVDWNKNNILDDAGEVFPLTAAASGSPRVFSGTIHVPLYAVLGNTRLRVREDYGPSNDPCASDDYGNIEDYTVTILAEPLSACCLPDLSCQSVTASSCTSSLGGTSQDIGSACATGLCALHTCCTLDGSVCVLSTQLNCASVSGIYSATATACSGVSCPAVGRCCTSNNAVCAINFGDAAHCPTPGTNFLAGATCATNACAYCTPTITYPCNDPTFGASEYISRTTFASIDNPNACGQGYQNFTALTGGDLHLNDSVAISVSVTNWYDEFDSVSVFVDWNKNKIFGDSGELFYLFDSTPNAAGAHIYTGVITVPNDMGLLGATRLRVRESYGDSTNPCDDEDNGNVEDYAVNILPERTGACCVSAVCQFLTVVNCANVSGLYQGDDVTCAQANCATGACCLPAGGCSFGTQANCNAAAGVYRGNLTACGSVNPSCPTGGSCCDPSGTCSITTLANCATPTGWRDGGICNPSPCPGQICQNPIVLALNVPVDGDLADSTGNSAIDCSSGVLGLWYSFTAPSNGVYRFDSSTTSGDGFPSLGLFQNDCATAWPPATGSGANCINPGAGTDASTDQVLTTGQQVLFRAGGYADIELSWSVVVSALGACCHTDGTCTGPDTQLNCAGTFGGPGSTCIPNTCPQPQNGACCITASGNCAASVAGSTACTALGGVYQGNGSSCGSVNCPQPTGACCNGLGGCTPQTAANCTTPAGAFQGVGVACGPTRCGICCRGATCNASIFTSAGCTTTGAAAGHAYVTGACSGSHFSPCCEADYNKSGGAQQVNDIFNFLTDWFNHSLYAFPGGNGTTTQGPNNGAPAVAQIFNFLTDWFGPHCP